MRGRLRQLRPQQRQRRPQGRADQRHRRHRAHAHPRPAVGAVGGYETFKYDFALLDGRLKGSGWTVGGYTAWRLAVGIGDGWSGRVSAGMTARGRGGGALALGGDYGGLGANYKVWSARAGAHFPL